MKVTAITKLAKEYPRYNRDKMRLANPRKARKVQTSNKFVTVIGKLVDCYA